VVESTSDLVGIADLTDGSLLYLNSAAQELFAPEDLDRGIGFQVIYGELYPSIRSGNKDLGGEDLPGWIRLVSIPPMDSVPPPWVESLD